MEKLLNSYENYHEKGLDMRFVAHDEIIGRLQRLPGIFTVSPIGASFEERAIYGVRAGTGTIRVLLWTQMHGDESTATRSLFDVFNFLTATDSSFQAMRTTLLEKLELYFIPMLNPDGAMRWQRETAQQIDMNRDARRVITPEATLLQSVAREFNPQFAFNLHDQSKYYSAGFSKNPATITLQAPPADWQETVTHARKQAIQLVVWMNRLLQQQIPNCVGRWNDDYEPRAFGEWFQSQKAATVLIESGAYYNDPERNYTRKLHFSLLLNALYAIAAQAYEKEDMAGYKNIPLNRKEGIFDRIERGKTLSLNGKSFISDIGYRDDEKLQVTGDLQDFGSLEGALK